MIAELLKSDVCSEIKKEREIIWLGFQASAAFEIDSQKIPEADGWSTDLSVPIEPALRKLSGFYCNIQTDGEFSTGI